MRALHGPSIIVFPERAAAALLPAALAARIALVALIVITALAALIAPLPAVAERADRNKPINVEADRMQYDDLKQINVFTGNVVLTKGTIQIRADRLVIRQDPEGYQYGTATGSLASFRQKREGVDQYISGRARQIDYDGKLETFRLQQQAMMQRTDGPRVIDEVHGSDILYESRSEFFTV
ncbi:MAG: lipopolysaccharide transport periplasmic protein LptA, partial [Burkholderiaceae bacterium]